MGHKIVCLDCRKAFNVGADYDNTQSTICPDCGKSASRFSHRFRPPRRNAVKQWEVVRFLHQNGFHYQHIHQPGVDYAPYPTKMNEAQEFVKTYAAQARKTAS